MCVWALVGQQEGRMGQSTDASDVSGQWTTLGERSGATLGREVTLEVTLGWCEIGVFEA